MPLLFIFGYIFLEIYSLMILADIIGGLQTLLWDFVAAALGFWLIRENGRESMQRMMMGMQEGISPEESLLDNLFVLLAGLLLIIPGVFSDCLALLLLIPQIRRLFFGKTMRFVQAKGPKMYANNTVFFSHFGGGSRMNNSHQSHEYYHDAKDTMDAEYTVREQAPRKTTAVIIESEALDDTSSPKSSSSTPPSDSSQ